MAGDFEVEAPDLKTLKASDLLSMMWGTMGSIQHKEDCDLKLLKGVCSCGLDKLRKDTEDLIKKLPVENGNGEKR